MLDNLINEGLHYYISSFMLVLIMINLLKGKKSDGKEIINDLIAGAIITLLEIAVSRTGIYRTHIISGLSYPGAYTIIELILVYVYVKYKYEPKYIGILALFFYLLYIALNVSYIYVILNFVYGILNVIDIRDQQITGFLFTMIEYIIVIPAIVYFISKYVFKKLSLKDLYLEKKDEWVLIIIYIITYLLLLRSNSIFMSFQFNDFNSKEAIEYYRTMRGNELVITLGIVVISLLNTYFYTKASKLYKDFYENKISNTMKKCSENYLDEVIKHSEKISKLSHDFKNHMMVIETLASEENDEIKSYIEPLIREKESLQLKVRSGNDIVDIVLNEKIQDMEKLNIKNDVKAVVPNKMEISQYDLSAILFNTIDNAIEACTHVDNPEINIEITPKNDSLVYTIENNYDENYNGKRNYAEKDGLLSGNGTKIVKEIVEKYYGDMKIDKKNGSYRVSMFFKI
ncbi:sensor histidine kinase [Peptostreptococcus canis]|uniref:GHKL domain-containing protein n=1 Tax=Peptostreptococcus canis TaxID=1159213 RepID=A0ABR6TMV5_9FIRM|nr:GHKL domain-containing protein [Peptostreptococcus canis]MBC2576748.1 GHKL domain-containing protein [Peptostreptococcus canis]MBP1998847.1 hypothetical protein [Peptostreptococcus canis]